MRFDTVVEPVGDLAGWAGRSGAREVGERHHLDPGQCRRERYRWGPPRNLIEFRDVSLCFGSEVVYAGLDLEIREGEFFCCSGLPDAENRPRCDPRGASRLRRRFGQRQWREPERALARHGLRLPEPAAFPGAPPRENVALGMEPRQLGMTAAAMAGAPEEFLGLAGLGADGHEYRACCRRRAPARLAGPRARRRSRHHPDGRAVLALDPNTRRRMREELVAIWQRTHKAIVFVTHDVEGSGRARRPHRAAIAQAHARDRDHHRHRGAGPVARSASAPLAALRQRVLASFHDLQTDAAC